MKKVLRGLFLKSSTILASLALVFGVAASSAECYWYFHQPKVPQGMEKYKKT